MLWTAGFTPADIIDIRVRHGTDGLYDVWPEVALCLIEPSHKAQQLLADFAARRPGLHLVPCASSDREGEANANDDGTRPYLALGGHDPKWEPIRVGIRLCDDIVRDLDSTASSSTDLTRTLMIGRRYRGPN